MQLTESIIRAKTAFSQERSAEMSDEEFCILLITNPAFKVANADDNFDEEERALMSTLLTNLLKEVYGSDLQHSQYDALVSAYLDDFTWLHENHEVDNQVMGALRDLCSQVDGLKTTVIEMMNDVAAVSEDVSSEETEVIEQISSII